MATDFQIVSKTAPLLEYLKKQRENDRIVKTTEIAITFLFISFFAIFAIQPAITTISALLGEIKSKEILTKSMKTKINQVIMAQDSFASVQEKYLVVNSSLPDSQNYSNLMIQVLGSASQNDVAIEKVSFKVDLDSNNERSAIIQNENVKEFLVTYDGISGFENGLKFLTELRNNRRLTQIDSLSITATRDANNKEINVNRLNYHIQQKSFYWIQPNNEKK